MVFSSTFFLKKKKKKKKKKKNWRPKTNAPKLDAPFFEHKLNERKTFM